MNLKKFMQSIGIRVEHVTNSKGSWLILHRFDGCSIQFSIVEQVSTEDHLRILAQICGANSRYMFHTLSVKYTVGNVFEVVSRYTDVIVLVYNFMGEIPYRKFVGDTECTPSD